MGSSSSSSSASESENDSSDDPANVSATIPCVSMLIRHAYMMRRSSPSSVGGIALYVGSSGAT